MTEVDEEEGFRNAHTPDPHCRWRGHTWGEVADFAGPSHDLVCDYCRWFVPSARRVSFDWKSFITTDVELALLARRDDQRKTLAYLVQAVRLTPYARGLTPCLIADKAVEVYRLLRLLNRSAGAAWALLGSTPTGRLKEIAAALAEHHVPDLEA